MTGTPHQAPSPALAERIRDADLLDLVSVGAVLVQLANMQTEPVHQVLLALVAVPLLASPRLRANRWCWLAFLGLCVLWTATRFLGLDNHVIASTYLVGIVTAARFADRPERVLRIAAALTIGLIFAFATGWKVGSGQYLDGTFFRSELLFDDRFGHVAALAGTDGQMRAENLLRANQAVAEGPGASVVLVEGDRTTALVGVMTWWTLLIEAAVAGAFLVPWRRLEAARHLALLGFMAGAYLAVPVAGFGSLLAVLGAAAARDRRWRVVYVAAFALLLVWSSLWRALFG